jgi:hypothetical protein
MATPKSPQQLKIMTTGEDRPRLFTGFDLAAEYLASRQENLHHILREFFPTLSTVELVVVDGGAEDVRITAADGRVGTVRRNAGDLGVSYDRSEPEWPPYLIIDAFGDYDDNLTDRGLTWVHAGNENGSSQTLGIGRRHGVDAPEISARLQHAVLAAETVINAALASDPNPTAPVWSGMMNA